MSGPSLFPEEGIIGETPEGVKIHDLVHRVPAEAFVGERQVKLALRHVLLRIRLDARVAYVFGPGTEAFELLTGAAATLFKEPLENVRKAFTPVVVTRQAKKEGA